MDFNKWSVIFMGKHQRFPYGDEIWEEGRKDICSGCTHELDNSIMKDNISNLISKNTKLEVALESSNEKLETLLKQLKDKNIIKSWYYNGEYHWEFYDA